MSIHPPDHKYTQPQQKGEPYYHDKFGHKLYYINGLGWNTKEWVKLFLANWNRAVELWNNGYLFLYEDPSFGTRLDQQEYARICCAWIIPFEMVEPHCVAEGL